TNTGERFPGTWNANGTILLRIPQSNTLGRIAASGGGEPVLATRPIPGQSSHALPQFLPDGRHFLFVATGNPELSRIYVGSLDGAEATRLTAAADSPGAYLSPEMIVFVRGTTLVAQHLDLKRWELTGDPVRLADNVVGNANFPASASADGRVVAYRVGGGNLR